MTHPNLNALSPLDGRYQTKTNALATYFSEKALMYHRLVVEIAWLQSLSENKDIQDCPELSSAHKTFLKSLLTNFNDDEALAIKAIEKTTNHDVKAIEYYLQEKLNEVPSMSPLIPFIHFALTSEDINNVAYALMIRGATLGVCRPKLESLQTLLKEMATEYAKTPMLSRTHGQAASPTTVGKEFANFVARLKRPIHQLMNVPIFAKCNGATGNYNAHHIAYPNVDWQKHTQHFIETLGLTFQAYTTQIEPHDGLSELFQSVTRINNILTDYARDIWLYISLNAFKQKKIENEVGSSTMPHKINPIDFENAEGNLGLSNALLEYFSDKLPKSRLQRDLSDSTVLRNIGAAFGYAIIAWESLLSGTKKLEVNQKYLLQELNEHWEVLGEAVQTVMRRDGISDAYEQLKMLTRGEAISEKNLHEWIHTLPIPDDAKNSLLSLSPETYIGLSEKLARDV